MSSMVESARSAGVCARAPVAMSRAQTMTICSRAKIRPGRERMAKAGAVTRGKKVIAR